MGSRYEEMVVSGYETVVELRLDSPPTMPEEVLAVEKPVRASGLAAASLGRAWLDGGQQ